MVKMPTTMCKDVLKSGKPELAFAYSIEPGHPAHPWSLTRLCQLQINNLVSPKLMLDSFKNGR